MSQGTFDAIVSEDLGVVNSEYILLLLVYEIVDESLCSFMDPFGLIQLH
jgi:hypothetical protein